MRKHQFLKLLLLVIVALGIYPACSLFFPREEPEFLITSDWVFINRTDHHIDYSSTYNSENFSVLPQDQRKFTDFTSAPVEAVPVEFFEGLVPLYTEAVLINQSKCDSTLALTLRDLSAYSWKELESGHFEFTFEFTQAVIDTTKACQ